MAIDDLEARGHPFDRFEDPQRIVDARGQREFQLECDFRLEARLHAALERHGGAVIFREMHGPVVHMRPDRRGGAVFGPDVAVGEADLASYGLFAARAPYTYDSRRDPVCGFPVEVRIALDDRRNDLALIERFDQFADDDTGKVHAVFSSRSESRYYDAPTPDCVKAFVRAAWS